jgi:hypothetical protein
MLMYPEHRQTLPRSANAISSSDGFS